MARDIRSLFPSDPRQQLRAHYQPNDQASEASRHTKSRVVGSSESDAPAMALERSHAQQRYPYNIHRLVDPDVIGQEVPPKLVLEQGVVRCYVKWAILEAINVE